MMRKREEDKILDVNATMQGNMIFSDPVNLHINGRFDGNLTTKGSLTIGEQALVTADIIGERINIAGKMKGTIRATKVVMLIATAEVNADIEAPQIIIEEGAVFNGRCQMPAGKLSLKGLSDYLSIEEDKIMEWVNHGRIPVVKEGENLLFDRKEVEVWISENV